MAKEDPRLSFGDLEVEIFARSATADLERLRQLVHSLELSLQEETNGCKIVCTTFEYSSKRTLDKTVKTIKSHWSPFD